MRKLSCCFASLLLLLAAQAATETVGGVEWAYTVSGGKAQIGTGYTSAISQSVIGSVKIPSTLGDCPVTSIGNHAFDGCIGLTSMTIPASVTSIGESAFNCCYDLASVTIPASVTSIGDSAFRSCGELTSVTIPTSVKSIGEYAFQHCSGLRSVTIPSSLTSVSDCMFQGCSGLTSVTIPLSVTSIGNSAFALCSGLTSVTIPPNVTSIGDSAFSGCNGLTSMTIPSSVTSIGEAAFDYCNGLTSVTIPASVTSIGDSAFRGCDGLTSVTIPGCVTSLQSTFPSSYDKIRDVTICSGVTSVADYTFQGCRGLLSVSIPASVTSIGDSAFRGCSGLTSVTIPGCVTSLKSAFPSSYDKIRSVTICSGVTSVGDCMFQHCNGLRSVTIPASVASIGRSAFYGCSGLTSITIPTSVRSIGDCAFYGCSGLKSVTIPTIVTSIADYSFYGCSGLSSVTIPSSVRSIGCYAFSSCSGLTSVTIPTSVKSIGEYAFQHCSGLRSVTIPSSVTSIGDYVFSSCSELASVTIPNSVKSIGYHAFAWCSELTSVAIPSSVTSIGGYAFYGCSGLTSVTIPTSVTWIGEYAFFGTPYYNNKPDGMVVLGGGVLYQYKGVCPSSVTIPSSVTSIGDKAFFGCSGLKSVTIPSSVMSVGEGAFKNCSLETILTAVGDGNRVKEMLSSSGFQVSKVKIICTDMEAGIAWTYVVQGGQASVGGGDFPSRAVSMWDVDGEITIPDVLGGCAVTGVGNEAFNSCGGLTHITIPSSVKDIGQNAFASCWSLESMVVPDSVMSLGEGAFAKCAGLASVTLSCNITTIKDRTFEGCSSLLSISIPDAVSSISSSAFGGCWSLKEIVVGEQNRCYSSVGGVLYDKEKTALLHCPAKVDVPLSIPLSVTKIGPYAFQDFDLTESFVIPNGVQSLESHSFANHHSLTTLTIPQCVTSIGKDAFAGCSGLKTFYVRSGDVERVKNLVETSGFSLKGTEWIELCSVSFELGAHGKRIGGGALNQVVATGGAAIPPTVESDYGWVFKGWDKSFDKVTSDLVVSACWSRVEWTVNVQNPDGSMTPHAVEHEGKMNFTAPKSTIDMDDKRQIVYLGSSVTAPEVLSQFELSVTNDMLVVWDVRATNFWLATSSPVEDAYYVTVNEWVAANDTRWVYVHPAAHWHLVRWTGDVEGCTPDGNRLKVVMDRPRTIGAELAQDEFKVEFDLGGKGSRTGGGSLQQSVVYGGRATVPDVVSNYGWVFEGWDRDLSQGITGNVTIHAFWRCIKFSETVGGVTYDYLLQDGVAVLDNNGAVAVSGVATGGAVVVPESLGGSLLEAIGEGAFRGNKSIASVSLPVAVTSIGVDAFAGCDNLTAVRVADVASWLDVSFANAAANPLNNGAALYVRPTTANWFDAGIGDYVDWPSGGADKVIEGVGTWQATANAVLEREAGVSWLSSVCRNAVWFEVDSPRKTSDGTVVVEAVMTASAVGTLPEVASDVKCGVTMVVEGNGLKCVGVAKSSSGAFNDWVLLDGCLLEEGQQIALSVSTKKVSGQTYVKYAVNGVELTHGGETWLPMVAESDSIREVSFVGELFSLSGEMVSGGDESAVVDLIIPEGVERVGDYAFAGCASIVNVVIPESVTSVAPTAFIGCANLKTITLKRKGMDLSWIPDGCEIVYDIDYLVTFDLGAHGERTGGGALQQLVRHGSAAVAPEVLAESGWEFVGWDCAFDAVTDALTVKAVWAELIQDPVILPGDGSVFYDESCMVTITCATAGAKIYYSTSGTPRTTDAYLYTEPFEIDGTASVKAIAVRDGKKSGYVTATITKSVMGLAEAVDALGVGFETGGSTGWRGLPDADAKVGGFVAKSGTTEPNQTNWLEARVEGPGVLTFWWKVNCEEDDSGDCTWDRLMYFVDDAEKDAERIDGVTSWAQCRVEFKTAGWHKVRWEFYRDGEDDPDLVYANCGWVDGVVWTPSDPIPDLGNSPSTDAVAQALADANDPLLKQRVTDGGMYKAYRDWAMRLAARGTADLATIKSSSTSWISFALDSACLLEKMPSDGDLFIKQFSPSGNAGAYDFSVEVKGAFVGGNALKDNLKLVFGLEGAGSLSPSAFSAENVDVAFAAPADGKLNFTAKPAKPADTFFMKMRVKP